MNDDIKIRVGRLEHPNGMPAMNEISIHVGPVEMIVSKEGYSKLSGQFTQQAEQAMSKATAVYESWLSEVRTLGAAVQDLRQLFYEPIGEEMFGRKTLAQINEGDIDAFIEKYKQFMGLE